MDIMLPTFSDARKLFAQKIIAHMWVNDRIDPLRKGFRPSFDDLYGPGSDFQMPLAASWLSTGRTVPLEERNVVAFPRGADRSFVQTMERMGVLGEHVFTDFPRLYELSVSTHLPLYNVDELPESWDGMSANKASTMRFVNTKKELGRLSSFAAPYTVVDLRRTTEEDFDAMGGGRVYVKLNNTEGSGIGVHICDTAQQYRDLVRKLLWDAQVWHLDFDIVLQGKIEGVNKSFQYILHPEEPNHLHLLTLSDQYVEEDGKTYASSVNAPLALDTLRPEITHLMADMARKIQALDPQAFGCVMCDYFELPDGRLLAFDPGLRSTGNTATVMAKKFVEEQVGGEYMSSLFFVPSQKSHMAFDQYIQPIDRLFGPDAAVRDGCCVMPWGYNHIQGRGLFIGVARTREELQNVVEDTKNVLMTG